MVALDLTPGKQRGPLRDARQLLTDRPVASESSWLGATGGYFGGWGCSGNSSEAVERVRRQPQPPQLSLPIRCLVSDATAGRRARPYRRLPTGGQRRLSGGLEIRIQTRGEGIDFRTSRSNSRVLKTEHRACSHNP